MLKNKTSILLCAPLFLSLNLASPMVLSEDTEESCKAAYDLLKDGDVKAALEEARWCVEGLEQMQQKAQKELLAANIDGWKRESLSSNKALGMTVTEARYSKGSESIELNITGGGNNFAGAAFAQMGMMQAGSRVRLGAYKGTLISGETLMIPLGEGRFITLTPSSASDDSLKSFAKALPLSELAK